MAEKSITRKPLAPIAMALAWIVPGAGHVYIGRPVRGLIIFFVIGATFWGGMAIGGVMTIDSETEPWWFAADMLTGAHGMGAWQYQRRIYEGLQIDAVREADSRNIPIGMSRGEWQRILIDQKLAEENLALVAPTETVARAYCGVAGMLNLLCIFDAAMLAAMGVVGEQRSKAQAPSPAPAST
jgi:hypothetical protein